MLSLNVIRVFIFSALGLVAHSLSFETSLAQAKTSLELAEKSRANITFSGLRVYGDGSSSFQVKISGSTPVKFSQNGKSLRFLLSNAEVELRNNRNPLRAEYFHSNVVRAQLKNTRKGALLSIELRKSAQVEHNMLKHAGGVVLRIDIPAVK